MSALATVNAFLATWSLPKQQSHEATHQYFLPTTIYENVGLSRTVGPEEAVAMALKFEDELGYDHVDVEILSEAVNESVVFNERVDRLICGDGSVLMEVRVLGIFEVADGKITALRDYFDASRVPR